MLHLSVTDRQTVLLYRTIPAAPHTITPEHINQNHGRRPGPATDRMCTNTAYTPPHCSGVVQSTQTTLNIHLYSFLRSPSSYNTPKTQKSFSTNSLSNLCCWMYSAGHSQHAPATAVNDVFRPASIFFTQTPVSAVQV